MLREKCRRKQRRAGTTGRSKLWTHVLGNTDPPKKQAGRHGDNRGRRTSHGGGGTSNVDARGSNRK